jgi:ATP-binding cassette subfamily B protein
LRNSIGIVPQDAFLFSDSISNIKFGKEDATDEEVESAAKSAVHDNIIGFKKQYETVLEKRITLSGGQKQKSVYRQSDN